MVIKDAASYPVPPVLPAFTFQTQDSSKGNSPRNSSLPGTEWSNADPIPSLSLLTPEPTFSRMHLRFLARFTATHGMANSFECGDTPTRRRIISGLPRSRNNLPTITYEAACPVNTGPTPSWMEASEPATEQHGLSFTDTHQEHGFLSEQYATLSNAALAEGCQLTLAHPVARKSREIVWGIRNAMCSGSISRIASVSWSESRDRSCTRFFSPTNLELFIGTFFQIWYPNWPIFHKPTFNATQKPPQLIAALSLIGACLSPETKSQNQAKLWMEAVEDWIFSDPDFCEDAIPQTDDDSQLTQISKRLDIVQAAYAVILLMNWEGDKAQRTRARRIRFSEIVCIARSLYFFATPQTSHLEDFGSVNYFSEWTTFALREECIRTLLYVFLIDCAFVMFYNSVPRMVMGELQFSLANPDQCFLAPAPDTGSKHAQVACQSQILCQGVTLSKAINMMMNSEIGSDEGKMFEQMNILNLSLSPARSTTSSSIIITAQTLDPSHYRLPED
ncbi:hypothetical protein FBEOM_13316 [Fusarium beomiforme]|uniref:Xylanolytic transcriptional activator regulatory domain-containing protein n=1 Tax=Fusarium beomiforme TaxID=44412 RepID=A0A9P5DS82_9HYPO|nr:hypothetical protein FBEOM_13316 [Fusarium beomiforme]